MKRVLIAALSLSISLQAVSIKDLFEDLKKQPSFKLDQERVKAANLAKERIKSSFYPSINLFASYEHYNSPSNLRPLPPTEATQRIKDKEPLPFAATIERIGVKASMPIFVKSLFSLYRKAKIDSKNMEIRKRLNLLENEALIVGLNASWIYLENLKKSLKARKRSILKIYEDTKIKADLGRAPGIRVDYFKEALNRLDISINQTKIKISETKSKLNSLISLDIQSPVNMKKKEDIKEGEFFSLKPIKYAIKAKEYQLKAKKEDLWPKLSLEAEWSENRTPKEISLKESMNEGYGKYALYLSVPLSKTKLTDIQIAKTALLKEKLSFAKLQKELKAKAKNLKETLSLTKESIKLAENSVKHQKTLLKYAKVAFKEGRMQMEEYLRYEENVLNAKASLYEAKMRYWQTLSKLAVIYGNDLERIVE